MDSKTVILCYYITRNKRKVQYTLIEEDIAIIRNSIRHCGDLAELSATLTTIANGRLSIVVTGASMPLYLTQDAFLRFLKPQRIELSNSNIIFHI